MGIPKFYYWVRQRKLRDTHGVVRFQLPPNIASLSLDANSLFYKGVIQVYDPEGKRGEKYQSILRQKMKTPEGRLELQEQHFSLIVGEIMRIVNLVGPQKALLIAVDGVAPMAKVQQQRQRRFRSAVEREKSIFDTNVITPGTDFMFALDEYLRKWITESSHLLPQKVIYSSHLVPGEGEHKILMHMRNGDLNFKGAHVIWGLDADLLLLGLLSPLENIYLARDMEDMKREKNPIHVVQTSRFRRYLQETMGTVTCVEDFLVLMVLLGNDFVPKIFAFNDMDKALEVMLQVYNELNISLVVNQEVNYQTLALYLEELSKHEHLMLEDLSRVDYFYPSRLLDASRLAPAREEFTGKEYFDYDKFRSLWYNRALGPVYNSRNMRSINRIQNIFRSANISDPFELQIEEVEEMCANYLEAISWIITYYLRGLSSVNTDFVYKFNYAPLLSDLTDVSYGFEAKGYMATVNQEIMSPVHQLLSVLPLKSKEALPEEVLFVTKFKTSDLIDLYPVNFVVELEGLRKNQEHMGIVRFPSIEKSRIDRFVRELEKSEDFTNKYSQVAGPWILVHRDQYKRSEDKCPTNSTCSRQRFNNYYGRSSSERKVENKNPNVNVRGMGFRNKDDPMKPRKKENYTRRPQNRENFSSKKRYDDIPDYKSMKAIE